MLKNKGTKQDQSNTNQKIVDVIILIWGKNSKWKIIKSNKKVLHIDERNNSKE